MTIEARIEEARAAALALAKAEALATYREMELEAERPVAKHAAILRIMERQTAPSGKPHSYSSAEALAETDAEYAAFLQTQREHRREAIVIRAKAWAARTVVAQGIALLGQEVAA